MRVAVGVVGCRAHTSSRSPLGEENYDLKQALSRRGGSGSDITAADSSKSSKWFRHLSKTQQDTLALDHTKHPKDSNGHRFLLRDLERHTNVRRSQTQEGLHCGLTWNVGSAIWMEASDECVPRLLLPIEALRIQGFPLQEIVWGRVLEKSKKVLAANHVSSFCVATLVALTLALSPFSGAKPLQIEADDLQMAKALFASMEDDSASKVKRRRVYTL